MFALPDAFTVDLTAPLQFPATLPLPRSFSPSVQATSQAHSNMYPQENVSVGCYDLVLDLHSFRLDPYRLTPNLLPPLAPPSRHDYTTYQPGGPLVQVMHYRLLSMFPLLRVNWYAQIILLAVFQISLIYLQRYATAGAPTFDDDLIRDEDYAPSTPPSPHPNLQQPSTGVQVTTGQHGSGRLCGCF